MTGTLARATLAVSLVFGGIAAAQETPPPLPQDSLYVGADACKACHANYYDAWQHTKHARAILSLSAEDRAGSACIRCHVTGAPDRIAAEGANPSLPGVQCEACHGAGKAHAEAARAGTSPAGGIVKTPAEKTCVGCHNDQSPHFRGFFYSALVPLVHKVK